MKISITNHQQRQGFTIVELTVVMLIGLMISAATLGLFSNQIAMFSTLRTQNFLLRDAPQINSTLNKIVPRANAFQMFASINNLADANGVTADASVLALRFNSPTVAAQGDATLNFTYSVIAFDAATGNLNYYNNLIAPSAINANTPPSWRISSNISNVVFFVQNGVIRARITGNSGEQITFSSTTSH